MVRWRRKLRWAAQRELAAARSTVCLENLGMCWADVQRCDAARGTGAETPFGVTAKSIAASLSLGCMRAYKSESLGLPSLIQPQRSSECP